MPFYEYECQNCKFYTEVLQKISDAPLKKCPSCGKNALQKLVSAPVFRLKGAGWYETDFKSDKEAKRNLAGGDKDESRESKSETKSSKASSEAKTPAASTPAAEPAAAKRRSATAGGKSAARSVAAKGRARAPSRAPAKSKSKPKAKKGRR